MKKMMKQFGASIMLIVVALWLAAGASLAQQITLTVYVRTSTSENAWEKTVFDMYMKEHPNVTIKTVANGSTDYLVKLTTLFASGNPPDVWDHGGYVATYRYNGWLLNLNPLIQRDKAQLKLDDIYPGAWKAYIGPNFAAGLPFISLPSPLWYNADLFAKAGLQNPPVSWDDSSWAFGEFAADAKKLTRLSTDGKVTQWGANLALNDYEGITFSYLGSSDWFNKGTWDSGIPEQSTFASPKNVAVYQEYVQMLKDGTAMANGWSQWFDGKVGMNAGQGGWIGFGEYSGMKFHWGMAPLPRSPEEANVIYTDAWMISSKTKHAEAAWDLVKFLTSAQAEVPYMKIAVFPPVRPSVLKPFVDAAAKASGVMTQDQIWQTLEGAQKYGIEAQDHRLAGDQEYRNAISPLFSKMVSGQLSVKAALTEMDQVVKPIIAKYQAGAAAGKVASTQ